MRMFVIERQSVCPGIRTHVVPYSIIDLRHQVALLDVQHFVETIRDMKPEPVRAVDLVQSAGGFDDFPRQPFAIRTGKFQFVAVLVHM